MLKFIIMLAVGWLGLIAAGILHLHGFMFAVPSLVGMFLVYASGGGKHK